MFSFPSHTCTCTRHSSKSRQCYRRRLTTSAIKRTQSNDCKKRTLASGRHSAKVCVCVGGGGGVCGWVGGCVCVCVCARYTLYMKVQLPYLRSLQTANLIFFLLSTHPHPPHPPTNPQLQASFPASPASPVLPPPPTPPSPPSPQSLETTLAILPHPMNA